MSETPWFGYAPAERVADVSDAVLKMVPDHDIERITDEMWMDIIVEDKFIRSIDRHDHGTKVGGKSRCQCFLCRQWREEESRMKIVDVKIPKLEDLSRLPQPKGPRMG